jgi:peptidyl-prolyl cis-trans isomerase D
MGVMTTLRNKAGIIMVVAIVLAIVAFLVSDAVQSGQPFLQQERNKIGEMYGEEISYQEFDIALQGVVDNVKRQLNSNSLDESMMGYAVDQAWNQYTSEKIIDRALEKSGVQVSPDELADMIKGNNINQEVRRAFTDPNTGLFNPQQVVQFLQSLDQDETGERKRQWLEFERSLKKQRQQQKYFNLFRKSIYVTTTEAEDDLAARSKQATIEYVLVDYNTISDSTVEVSESDLKAYYNDHKFKFKQKEEQRSIEYVNINIAPSAEDSVYIMEEMMSLKADFEKAEDDSAFVVLNAESSNDFSYFKKGDLSVTLDTILFNKSVGYIYGPYLEANTYKLAKVIGVKNIPDSVKARHILIQPENNDVNAAKAKADSLMAVLKTGADFAQLAQQFSADKGSAVKGGDLGFFTMGMMVKPFEDAAFFGKVNEYQLVASNFGYHIIQVQNQMGSKKGLRVGIVDRAFEPSENTVSEAFNQASAFLNDVNETDFDQAVEKAGMVKRVAENLRINDKGIAGLKNPREVIRWAYNANEGDVSGLFDLGTSFIIAKLTEVKPEGYIAFETIKEQLEPETKRLKKASMIAEKVAGKSSLTEIAGAFNVSVDTIGGITMQNLYIPGLAREPKVVGSIFGLKENTFSGPLEGNRGVYFLVVKGMQEAVVGDIQQSKMALSSAMKNRAEYELIEALKDKSKLKDFRYKFY